MSISKLLMTAAICTISMTAVSTSYGASEDMLDDDSERGRFPALTSSNITKLTSQTNLRKDQDAMSVGSSMSTISHDRLAPALKTLIDLLKKIPRDVTFPGGVVKTAITGAKPTQIELILTGYANLVDTYAGLLPMARESQNSKNALVRTLAIIKGEKNAEVIVSEDSVEGQIIAEIATKVAALDIQVVALKDAETKLIKAEASKTAWKVGTFITSAVLVAVAGVLINIFKVHGFEIIWGSNR